MTELEAQEFDPCFYAVSPLALRGDNAVLQWSIAAGAFGRTRTPFLQNSSGTANVFGPGITRCRQEDCGRCLVGFMPRGCAMYPCKARATHPAAYSESETARLYNTSLFHLHCTTIQQLCSRGRLA